MMIFFLQKAGFGDNEYVCVYIYIFTLSLITVVF